MKQFEKLPLYRKVNTKARGCSHLKGSNASRDRNTKKGISSSMKKDKQRGLDYTPLFRFLLSKVGQNWDDVYSEAVSRLDEKEPIFYMVNLNDISSQSWFKYDNSYYSKLKVDENNILQLMDENIKNEDFSPSCWCCTHTFNGKPLNLKHSFDFIAKTPS